MRPRLTRRSPVYSSRSSPTSPFSWCPDAGASIPRHPRGCPTGSRRPTGTLGHPSSPPMPRPCPTTTAWVRCATSGARRTAPVPSIPRTSRSICGSCAGRDFDRSPCPRVMRCAWGGRRGPRVADAKRLTHTCREGFRRHLPGMNCASYPVTAVSAPVQWGQRVAAIETSSVQWSHARFSAFSPIMRSAAFTSRKSTSAIRRKLMSALRKSP